MPSSLWFWQSPNHRDVTNILRVTSILGNKGCWDSLGSLLSCDPGKTVMLRLSRIQFILKKLWGHDIMLTFQMKLAYQTLLWISMHTSRELPTVEMHSVRLMETRKNLWTYVNLEFGCSFMMAHKVEYQWNYTHTDKHHLESNRLWHCYRMCPFLSMSSVAIPWCWAHGAFLRW